MLIVINSFFQIILIYCLNLNCTVYGLNLNYLVQIIEVRAFLKTIFVCIHEEIIPFY